MFPNQLAMELCMNPITFIFEVLEQLMVVVRKVFKVVNTNLDSINEVSDVGLVAATKLKAEAIKELQEANKLLDD